MIQFYDIPVQNLLQPSNSDLKSSFIDTILSLPREEDRSRAENQAFFKKQDRIASMLDNSNSVEDFDKGMKDYLRDLNQFGFSDSYNDINNWYSSQDWSPPQIGRNGGNGENGDTPNYLLWGSLILGLVFIGTRIK